MRAAAHNAKALQEAVAIAEHELVNRPKGTTTVEVRPNAIQIRPELFQPREFSFGLRETDPEFVKKLARSIGIQGELDPVLIIKLGKKFVCVDGHHRLQAYKAAMWDRPIRCEWFGGTVKEAVDESVARNAKDRLNVSQADRLENAWKRVLLDWGSKSEIVHLCGVGDGTVAFMRRVARVGREKSKRGEKFRGALGFDLEETSWAQARLAFSGAEAGEVDAEVRAERLARLINSRLTNLLSRDANVTARALELYDRELPKRLREAWRAPNDVAVIADEQDQAEAEGEAKLFLGERALRSELERHRARIHEIEGELARRAAGGAASDHTWAEWVANEPPG
jgi:hypothetical protein